MSIDALMTPEDEPSGGKHARRRRGRGFKVVAGLAVTVLLLTGAAVGLVFERQSHFDGNIERIPDVFPTQMQRAAPTEGENWLMLGSDRRSAEGTTGLGADADTWEYGAQRTDSILLLHIPKDRKNLYVVSFPRDSYVAVPDYGKTKINAAFSYGGPPLLIETIENLTKVRIDHFSILDFEGFKGMTDALGGVDVNIAQTVTDTHRNVTWKAGRNHLNGEQALLFVRQRYNLPNGDFDRIKRQQAFLKAIMTKAANSGTLTNPFKLNKFLESATKAVTVDQSVSASSLRSLALSMRGIRPANVRFLTVPVKGTGMVKGQSMVFLDPARATPLYDALRTDTMSAYQGTPNKVDQVR